MQKEEGHEYEALLIRQLEKFRLEKRVSQREMSLSIGQTAGYISKLTNPNNRYLPRMINFFFICDYFNIHPKDFFNDDLEHPVMINDILNGLNKLNQEQLSHILAIIKSMGKE